MIRTVARRLLPNSLKGRLLLASLVLIPLVCALLAWSLDRAHYSSLVANQKQQMMQRAYTLMASAELEGDTLWLPEVVTDENLNNLTSNTYALLYSMHSQPPIWRSLSATTKSAPQNGIGAIKIGEIQHGMRDVQGKPHFYLHYGIAWESAKGTTLPFTFAVYETLDNIQVQLNSYRQTLWLWLGSITLLLILMQLVILLWGLRPIDKLREDLNEVRQGRSQSLQGNYPKELQGMTASINQLLEHEQQQRTRYRHTLADLAHSIKNPVAIIYGALERLNPTIHEPALTDIAEQSDRINQIISHQLKRAVGHSNAPFHEAIAVKPIAEQIAAAMRKVYADKALELDLQVPANITFRGDSGDLTELLGNLMDNACKYGHHKVTVQAIYSGHMLSISIEDDGPGIAEDKRQDLLQRGKRADTQQAGQGIGLSVVEDIVSSYGGTIHLGTSALGGLKVTLGNLKA